MMDLGMLAMLAGGFLLIGWFADWCVHEVEKK